MAVKERSAGSLNNNRSDAAKNAPRDFSHANYVLTSMFPSKEAMDEAKRYLRERQKRRSFGFL